MQNSYSLSVIVRIQFLQRYELIFTLQTKTTIFISIFIIMETENKIIGVTLSPEILKLIEDGNYNRSKLIDTLLTKHFIKENLK